MNKFYLGFYFSFDEQYYLVKIKENPNIYHNYPLTLSFYMYASNIFT